MRRADDATDGRAAKQTRTRALLFLLVAGAAGLAAVFMVRRYTDQMAREVAEAAPKTTQVIVAAMDVPIATRLEAKHLMVLAWPSNHLPDGSFKSTAEVVGKTLRQDLLRGEPVLKARLAAEEEGRGLAALLPAGMRAMAVEVNAVVGVAGFVQPGDFVDVITTMRPDDETNRVRHQEAANIAKLILQDVKVLAVGEHLTTEPNGSPINVKVVTLSVSPGDSEKLALASQYGKVQLSLRSRVDKDVTATPGVSPAQLLASTLPAPPPALEEHKPERVRKAKEPVMMSPPTAAPSAPVVEILRGGNIESRTLGGQAAAR